MLLNLIHIIQKLKIKISIKKCTFKNEIFFLKKTVNIGNSVLSCDMFDSGQSTDVIKSP